MTIYIKFMKVFFVHIYVFKYICNYSYQKLIFISLSLPGYLENTGNQRKSRFSCEKVFIFVLIHCMLVCMYAVRRKYVLTWKISPSFHFNAKARSPLKLCPWKTNQCQKLQILTGANQLHLLGRRYKVAKKKINA